MARGQNGYRQGYLSHRRRRVVMAVSRYYRTKAPQTQPLSQDESAIPDVSLIKQDHFAEQEQESLETQAQFLEQISVNASQNAASEITTGVTDTVVSVDSSQEIPELLPTSNETLESVDDMAVFPFEPIGSDAVRALAHREEPTVWSFLGDENTIGVHTSFEQRSFVDLFGERIRWELRRFPDVIINAGIERADVSSCLEHAEERCFRFRPDAVFILCGTNDAIAGEEGLSDFANQLKSLVIKVREENAIPILQTPVCISYEGVHSIAALPAYVESIRAVAHQFSIPLIDHWRMTSDRPEEGIQLGDAGHKKILENLLHELDLFDANSDVCKLL